MSASVTKHKCYDFQRQRAPSVFYCNLQMKKEQLRVKLLSCEIPQGCPQANDGPGKQDQEEEIWRAFLPLPMVARSQKASVPTAMICKGFTPTPKSRAGADTLPPCSMTGAHTGHCCQSQVGWGMLQVHPTCGGERSAAQGVLGAQSCHREPWPWGRGSSEFSGASPRENKMPDNIKGKTAFNEVINHSQYLLIKLMTGNSDEGLLSLGLVW